MAAGKSWCCTVVILAFLFLRIKNWHFSEIPLARNSPEGLEFDYIIIGGGTAGSVVANRLSEDPEVTVLVLEAGDADTHPTIPLPSEHRALKGTSVDWTYTTAPNQNACLACERQMSWWPMGKTLGGSSSINGMIYVRGNKEDYNSWERGGARGWSFNEVLPYFKRIEDCLIPNPDPDLHGTAGPIPVSESSYTSDLAQLFLKAGLELGYNRVDYNGKGQIGFSKTQINVANGVRYSTAKGYLHPARLRKNVFVKTNARVRNIIIDQNTLKATGVSYYDNEKLQKQPFIARREVILSAGVVESPHTLMVSGVGPSDVLKAFKLPVLKDLPGVGKNLQDHIQVPLEYWVDNSILNQYDISNSEKKNSLISSLKYFLLNSGPLASVPMETVAFLNLNNDSNYVPNLEILFSSELVPLVEYKDSGFSSQAINQMIGYEPFSETPPKGFTLFPILLHPKSRGEVLLDTRDPFDPPTIHPQYLSDQSDVVTLLRGIRFVQKLVTTASLGKLKGEIALHKAKSSYAFDSDEFWEWFIRRTTWTLSHYAGTCKMGSASDPMAVVDERLKVIGIQGLRVVDASVIPTLPSGNIQASVMMIAEKAADMIKEDYN